MIASANQLYGICRELGFCVEDCGLCEEIAKPGTPRPRESTVFELPELDDDDELEQIAPPHRRPEKKCEVCGKVKRINHNCRPPKPKLPKATPVTWDDVQLEICGWCRRKIGGHYAWCDQQ